MPTSISNDNAAVVKYDAQQQLINKNGQDSHDDTSRRRQRIIPQSRDVLNEAATRSAQTSSNHSLRVTPSYMATKGKVKPVYPVINDVRTLQLSEQSITHQEGLTTMVHSPTCEQSKPSSSSAIQPVYNGQISLKDTRITPQRPQDLVSDVSLDVAPVNVRSSAQYRKSYAFKIWRDKGSFPYRLAEQPVVKEVVERKKSKKSLNAARAQKDRKNEEDWKQFKSCRTTSNDMRYRRTTKFPRVRVQELLMRQYEKEQLNTILSDSQEKYLKAKNIKHQNSIPDYFKNKKESAQKSQPLPVSPTKSIPTSVIHVNTTKACDVSKQITQAEQSMITTSKSVYNNEVLKSIPQTGAGLKSNPASEEILLADVEEYGSISQRSDAQTSCSGKYNIDLEQSQEQLNIAKGGQKISTVTMTECNSSSAESSSSLGESILSNKPAIQQKHHSTQSTSPRVTTNLNGFTDNSTPMGEGTTLLSTECSTGNTVNDQPSTTSSTLEPSVNSDTSNLALIIKNSLAKKYSKENTKPYFGSESGERGRKRVRNESPSSEEGQHRRARMKQEKASMFTSLDESVATNLADGIHNVNSEYFPIEALANKAAKETSKDNSDADFQRKLQTTSIKHKVDEIERARLLLKELFDVTSESGGDNEMKTFDVASRSFGRKNILNHLSLIDRYFAEFQKKLSNAQRQASLP